MTLTHKLWLFGSCMENLPTMIVSLWSDGASPFHTGLQTKSVHDFSVLRNFSSAVFNNLVTCHHTVCFTRTLVSLIHALSRTKGVISGYPRHLQFSAKCPACLHQSNCLITTSFPSRSLRTGPSVRPPWRDLCSWKDFSHYLPFTHSFTHTGVTNAWF